MRFATLAALALSLAAGPAAAFDLTGHWEGSWSCAEFDEGVKTKESNKESTAAITSLGNGTFRAVIDDVLDYRGIEITNPDNPTKGEIGIAMCGTNDDLKNFPIVELGRFKVSTSETGSGSLSGTSIWSANESHIATCKYKYKRIDTANPNLTYSCP
jgi:hypothetical protein